MPDGKKGHTRNKGSSEIKMMKLLIIIPARYASTRFPGKPLAEIGGKPVIQHVVEKAAKVSSDVFVATDDDRIYRKVMAFGGQAVMTAALTEVVRTGV